MIFFDYPFKWIFFAINLNIVSLFKVFSNFDYGFLSILLLTLINKFIFFQKIK